MNNSFFDLEDIETRTEELNEKEQSLSQREKSLTQGIQELENDAQLIASLEKNKELQENERQEVEQSKQDLLNEIEYRNFDVQEQMNKNEESRAQLDWMKKAGLDVAEAAQIVEDKEKEAEENRCRLEAMALMLGFTLTEEGLEKLERSEDAGKLAEKTLKEIQNEAKNDKLSALSQYMTDHNYGPDDFGTYSQDPDWRELIAKAYPGYQLPPLQHQNAFDRLEAYMNAHNFSKMDYPEYSQEPEWRNLMRMAYPDTDLPPLTEIGAQKALRQKLGLPFGAGFENYRDQIADDVELASLYNQTNPSAPVTPTKEAWIKELKSRLYDAQVRGKSLEEIQNDPVIRNIARRAIPEYHLHARTVKGRDGRDIPLIMEKHDQRKSDYLKGSAYIRKHPVKALMIKAGLNKVIREGSYSVMAKSKDLDSILSGGLKNLQETKTSGGSKNINYRNEISREHFGYTSQADNAEKEKYGFIGHKNPLEDIRMLEDHIGGASQYGDVQIVLKKENVKATYTFGDSMDNHHPDWRMVRDYQKVRDDVCAGSTGDFGKFDLAGVSDFESAERCILPGGSTDQILDRISNHVGYVEIQIPGEVTAKDIAELRIPRGYQISEQSRKIIEANGIKITWYNRRKEEYE